MAQTILLKRSATPGKVPNASSLELGEVAINTYDGRMYIKKNNGTDSVVEIGANPFPAQTGKVGMFLKTDGFNTYWSDTGGTATKIAQTGHGFSLGEVVRFDGTRYVRAQADIEQNADVIGIVTEIVNANSFEITTSGIITFESGVTFTTGQAYFLSATQAGKLTTIEPTAVGNISKPLLIALSSTSGLFYNWRGIEITKEVDIDALLPLQAGNAGNVLMSDGTSAGWRSIAEATATVEVTAPNSFTVGQLVRVTNNPSAPYALAQANTASNAVVFGIVSAASPASYTVTTFGKVTQLSGLSAGTLYYLSDTNPGLMVGVEPTSATAISKPVFIATSSTEGIFINQRGIPVSFANASGSQLLPSVTGQAGKVLTTDGVTSSWQSIGVKSISVGGITQTLQANGNVDITAVPSHTHDYAPTVSPAFSGTPTAPTASVGTNTTQIATTAFVQGAVSTVAGTTPAGVVMYFTGNTAPTGWLEANGAAVSRTTYAALFAVIGTTYGAGDGSTTFNLPDLRGEFIRSLDKGRGVDTGRLLGSAQAAVGGGLAAFQSARNPAGENNAAGEEPVPSDGTWSGWRVTGRSLDGDDHHIRMRNVAVAEVRPRNVALLACISTGMGGSSSVTPTLARSWKSVTASRVLGTSYTNADSNEIKVSVSVTSNVGSATGTRPRFAVYVGGVRIIVQQIGDLNGSNYADVTENVSFEVPPNTTYSVSYLDGTNTLALTEWAEFRSWP